MSRGARSTSLETQVRQAIADCGLSRRLAHLAGWHGFRYKCEP